MATHVTAYDVCVTWQTNRMRMPRSLHKSKTIARRILLTHSETTARDLKEANIADFMSLFGRHYDVLAEVTRMSRDNGYRRTFKLVLAANRRLDSGYKVFLGGKSWSRTQTKSPKVSMWD